MVKMWGTEERGTRLYNEPFSEGHVGSENRKRDWTNFFWFGVILTELGHSRTPNLNRGWKVTKMAMQPRFRSFDPQDLASFIDKDCGSVPCQISSVMSLKRLLTTDPRGRWKSSTKQRRTRQPVRERRSRRLEPDWERGGDNWTPWWENVLHDIFDGDKFHHHHPHHHHNNNNKEKIQRQISRWETCADRNSE